MVFSPYDGHTAARNM